MKPRILLDADGVLVDFFTPAMAVVERLLGKKYTIEDFPTWDLFDVVGHEHEPACYVEYEKEGFCASFEPYPGAVEGVRRLREVGDICVVTSPIHGRHWYYERVESMVKHFGFRPNDVCFKKYKQFEFGHILVDDRPTNVIDWAARHPHGLGLLWDQPYNRKEWPRLLQEHNRHGNLYRAHNWADVHAAAESVLARPTIQP
jgi:5'(3')-deoxyribonucleotidase